MKRTDNFRANVPRSRGVSLRLLGHFFSPTTDASTLHANVPALKVGLPSVCAVGLRQPTFLGLYGCGVGARLGGSGSAALIGNGRGSSRSTHAKRDLSD